MKDDSAHDYDYWSAKIANPNARVVAHVQHPGCGFYQWRFRGQRLPVAIWRSKKQGDVLVARRGYKGASVDESPLDVWPYCIDRPITEAAYRAAYESGRWPDDPGAEIDDSALAGATADLPPRSDNLPDDVEPLPEGGEAREPVQQIEARLLQLDRLAKKALDAGVVDKESADAATNLRDRLKALRDEGESRRREEKKPHDDAGKAVQAKWLPLLERIALAAGPLSVAITKWQKAEEARLKEAAAKAVAAGVDPSVVAVQPVRTGGAVSGRRSALRTFKSAKIVDYAKLLAAVRDHPEVKAAVQSIADASARSGIALDGMEIVEDRRSV